MTGSSFFNKSSGWIFSLLVPLIFGLYAVSLGQDTNWDMRNYHLYNPYSYLNNRISLDLAPAGLQTYFNPFLDVAYFSSISRLSPKIVGFLIGLIQGLNFILIYRIANNVLGGEHKLSNVYSLFLALAGMLSVGFLSEVGTTFFDSVVSIFPLLSLLLITYFIGSIKRDKRPVMALILCSGVLAGIGCGLKLTFSIYALALCVSFFVVPVRWDMRCKLSILFGMSVLIGLFAVDGYWMFRMWSLFGNPVFPQFNNVFHGELAPFLPMRDPRFLPETVFDKVFYPFIFTLNPLRVGELSYKQFSWIFAYVAVLAVLSNRIVLLFRTKSDPRPLHPEVAFLLAFFCISYFLWLNMFGIYRYLIPIELLIPLLLFVTISHFFKTRIARCCAIVFIGAITAVNLRGVPDWGHSEWAEIVYHVEPNALSVAPEPAAVYLLGQPLAWIIPALGIKAPFIQLASNMNIMSISDTAYVQRAKTLVEGRNGRSYIVLESDTPVHLAYARAGLAKLGLALNEASCSRMAAYLAASRFEYKYCEVKHQESRQ